MSTLPVLVKGPDNKVWAKVNDGHWQGLVQAEVVETKPKHRFYGKKLTMQDWLHICSFFEWSLQETKGETVVHLYYHDERGWFPVALPQEGHTGMTIKTLPDHENNGPTQRRIGNFMGVLDESGEFLPNITTTLHQGCLGTVHHHCTTSAFQSGTDHGDEVNQQGIHITVGHIGSDKYSFHARVNFNKTFSEAELSDWFELSSVEKEIIPEELHEAVLGIKLIKAPTTETRVFPEWWKENVIKRPPFVSQYGPNLGPMGFQSGNGSGSQSWSGNNYDNSRLPAHYRGGYQQSGGCGQSGGGIVINSPSSPKTETKEEKTGGTASSGSSFRPVQWFECEIASITTKNNTSLEEILGLLDTMMEEPIQSLVDAMVNEKTMVWEAVSIVRKMKEKEDLDREAYKMALEKQDDGIYSSW